MFIVRSAFWLTAAYLVLAPHAGADIGNAAQAVGQSAPQIAAAGISSLPCGSLECTAGRAAALGVLESMGTDDAPLALTTASAGTAASALMDAAVAPRTAPVPPERPDWAG
ncbi:hypothetical protein [Pelagibacterium xiamenense]|uniref:hypothetical protein n=1 Tax=Pelagibacterium xiamenense TaxID=2901140 RepID=UPI001E2C096D|nr:hypothetical protein [Pelagibacterium xiamenense]MCD7059429.1 hypothetical protein [Pelagibacterium xiamenense]